MIVAGKGVSRIGERDNTMVNTIDLFTTFANLAGSDSTQINDSKSLVPLFSELDTLRNYNYTDLISGWSISDGQYKLIHKFDGISYFFDLHNDPYEYNNLFLTSDSSLLTIIDELYYNGRRFRGELCLDNAYPNVSLGHSNETIQGAKDGQIHLSFEDEPTKQDIEFSLDGTSYRYFSPDSIGNDTIENLEPRSYKVFARWKNDECPVLIDTIHIMGACETAVPFATVSVKHEGNIQFNNGAITLSFIDDPTKHRIEFSIDGGLSYPYKISDASGSYTIYNLPPNTYHIWARWGSRDCATFLGTHSINKFQVCDISGPNVIVSSHNASSIGVSDGSIQFDFEGNAESEKIEFSIDGRYIYSTATSAGNYTIPNLSFGSYNLGTRWEYANCPTSLGKVHINEPCNSIPPIVKIYTTDESNPYSKDGSIQFSIVDIKSRGKIEFSIDGGLSFPLQVNTDSGIVIWDNLPPKEYDIWARWGNDECPVFLGTKVINGACSKDMTAHAAVSATHESMIGANDGSIQFSILDNPQQLHVQVSINGGITYPYTITNTDSIFSIHDLKPRNYSTWIRWAHQPSCPVFLGSVTINSPSCDDGVQNGDETGIDCGGTSCLDCDTVCSYQLLYEEDFEQGFGMWKNGGLDCRRNILDSLYASSGNYCVRIRDNSFYSKITSIGMDLSTYDHVRLDFNYMTRSMDNKNENYYLQMSLDGGNTFTLIQDWNQGDEFKNNVRYSESVEIPKPFSANTVFRFRCDASGYNDWVYLDDIKIYGCHYPNPIPIGNLHSSKHDVTSINAFPNPTKHQLEVEIYSSSDSETTFEVINMAGKIMFQNIIELRKGQNIQILDSQNYPQGIYMLKIKDRNSFRTLKFLKMD